MVDLSGGDGCYPMFTGGNRQLIFMNATSGSSAAVSTQIQFTVPEMASLILAEGVLPMRFCLSLLLA